MSERLGAPLVSAHPGRSEPGRSEPGPVVTGLTHDSRAVRLGDLYAALPGSHVHGATFAAAAASAGAVAALTDPAGAGPVAAAGLPAYVVADPRAVLGSLAAWVYHEPSRDLRVIGVTGTNGKTTTAYLLEAGLRAAGRSTGLIGTIETRIGDEPVPSERTTPEAPDLQALLAVMRERGVASVAMEVSSHALFLGRVDGTTYDVAIFTNLTEDHLDFHPDLASYFAAKAALFVPGRARVGVVNVDDAYGERLVAQAKMPMVSVSPSGTTSGADWRATGVTVGSHGGSCVLVGPQGVEVAVGTAMPGGFNLDNAIMAVAALAQTGLDLPRAAAGVAALTGVPGRMERVSAGQDFLAVVDYAHSPDALERLLATARALTDARVLVVVGAGGDRDPYKRAAMGEIAARGADVVVFTNDNPRSEDPLEILATLADAAATVPGGGQVQVLADRRAAITAAAALARTGDVLVVAGRGHEPGQEIAGRLHPFDDRVVLREALQALDGPGVPT